MKMRQKLIAVLAASMVVTSVPVVTMADTTNYVSAARYAKKGTTYGYTAIGKTKVEGTSGKTIYTDFNGFEFEPIMNYVQPGAMFMSLTQGTNFNALAIVTYLDSYNATTVTSNNNQVNIDYASTDLELDASGKVTNANTQWFNGKTPLEILKTGVEMKVSTIMTDDNIALPAKTALNLQEIRKQLRADIDNGMYTARISYVDMIEKLVNQAAKELDAKIAAKKGIDKFSLTDLQQAVNDSVTLAAQAVQEDMENGEQITTTQSTYYLSNGTVDLSQVANALTGYLNAEAQTLRNVVTRSTSNTVMTVSHVESFTVKDADSREYNSHLRVDFDGEFKKKTTYRVPLLAEVGGDQVVILNIDGKDSFVTSEKYNLTQNVVSDKRLIAASGAPAKIRPNYAEAIAEIKLSETEIGSLVAGDSMESKNNKGALNEYSREIKLSLPSSSGLEFNLDKTKRNLTITGKRGFYGKVADDKNLYDPTHVDEHNTNKHHQLPVGILDYARYERRNDTDDDRQTLIITLPKWDDSNAIGELALNGIFVQPIDESAPTGDVNITISEYVDSVDYTNNTNNTNNTNSRVKNDKATDLIATTTLKVAEVKEYDVAITCEKPAAIKAGRSGIINNKTVTFTLEESVKDSLADGRRITFELENGYLFGAADINPLVKDYDPTNGKPIYSNTSTTSGYKKAAEARFSKLLADDVIQLKINGKDKTKNVKFNEDDLKLIFDAEGRVIGFSTIYNELSEKEADKIEMTIPVATSVMSKDGSEVKVVAKNLTTRSFQDKEDPSAVIAKVASPIEVTFDGAKLKVGLQAQEAGSITIKETDKGMLERGWLFLTADINSGITFDKVPTVTIQSADGKEVKVENVALNKNRTVLGLEVSKTSLEASTIKISDVVLTADRTVPEANYDLVMWGSALTDESVRDIHGFDGAVNTSAYFGEGSDVYKVKEFVQMTTKNTEDITDSNNKAVTASFVIGESKFTVNGEEVAMDSAAYVKNGYTFVPVKYVAKAFGIEGNAVQYDKATSTATIIAGNKVINITNGKPFIVVNGTQVPMAVKAEVKEGRMCVPMAYIAAALDVQKSWDATTKTATFTNVTAPAAATEK